MKLYLVRAEDVNDMTTNLDWFVVADDIDQAIEKWGEAVTDFREDGPQNGDLMHIREVLPDVAGTKYDGEARFIPWRELPIVHEA